MLRILKYKWAMTLTEVVIAVAILGVAIVPIVGMINTYFRRAYHFGGTRDYVDRARNLMDNLLEKTSYLEIQRFNPVINADLTDRTTNIVEDISQIRSKIPISSGTAPLEITLSNYNPEHYQPVITLYEDVHKEQADTPINMFAVANGKTFFVYKSVKYYFSLEITNIPLVMSYKDYITNPPDGEILTERIFTRDIEGNLRDMMKKLVIKVNWETLGRKYDYSLVSFKANIETAFDNQ